MYSKTPKPAERSGDAWVNNLWTILRNILTAVKELAHGILANTLPWKSCCSAGASLSLALSLRLDRLAAKKIGILFLLPERGKLYWGYAAWVVTLPFWTWAMKQVLLRIKLVQRLKVAFVDSGLKTSGGRVPNFISNIPLDEYSQKLRLRNVGLSKSQFVRARETLGSHLQVFIDDIRENRTSGTVDLIYSHVEMPASSELTEMADRPGFRFIVGDTRGSRLTENLREVPHILIAGQTGAGKSTFLRQFITGLYSNNRGAHFTAIDLKGGLEFQIFEGLIRMDVMPDLMTSIRAFEKLETTLQDRMTLLKENRCKDLDSYLRIPGAQRKSAPELGLANLDREIVIVDEAAEMFLAGDHASPQEIQKARRILSRIARQGRAVGIHLVIATQRPDTKSLDPQVKANLTGVLCFAMQNDASSITVLGNGRATDLPADVPGRAIWKKNGDMIEVQTPFLKAEAAEKILEEIKRQEGEQNGSPRTKENPVTQIKPDAGPKPTDDVTAA